MRRDIVIDLIQNFCPKDSVGAEIGVYKGEMSKMILSKCEIQHLYMIDPYESGYTNFTESTDGNLKKMNSRFKQVSHFFAKQHPDKSTFIREKSEDAHSKVPNDLDFIFIDGNHAYEYVMKDLQLWVPKVKSGGLVIGDDWQGGFPGVVRAVQDYFRNCDSLESPFSSYEGLGLKDKHVNAPGKGKAVVNKSNHIWWGVRK